MDDFGGRFFFFFNLEKNIKDDKISKMLSRAPGGGRVIIPS